MKAATLQLMNRASVILLFIFTSHVAIAAQDIPQTSPDGLELVENSHIGILYVRPGADFSVYKRIALLDASVEFRDNWRRDQNRVALGASGRVSRQDAIDIQVSIADSFKLLFTESLEARGFAIAEFTAKDVLVLEPNIFNVDVLKVQDETPIGLFNYNAYTNQMSLAAEFYDSLTGEVIARVIDKQAVKGDGLYRVGNKVTNQAEAEIIIRRWSQFIGDYLSQAADGS